MPALVAGIHVFTALQQGHDGAIPSTRLRISAPSLLARRGPMMTAFMCGDDVFTKEMPGNDK
ncbi:MAG TPA: hypothetical protein VFK10_07975 [Burkholderiaceae bacterium]|nr:hypothetical protein [Burkholderiaceae bacterium]